MSLLEQRNKEYRQKIFDQPGPPHKGRVDGDFQYFCGCVMCCEWREVRVMPGAFCRPASLDPQLYIPGYTSAWKYGERPSWQYRLEPNGIYTVIVIGFVDPDSPSYVRKDKPAVVVLTSEKQPQTLVTFAGNLVVLG